MDLLDVRKVLFGVLLILAAVALPVSIALYVISRNRLRERTYGGRQRMVPDEYYLKYFQDTSVAKTTVVRVIEGMCLEMSLDFSRVDPDARFEAYGDLLTVDDWDGFGMWLKEELHVEIDNIPMVTTPRELIVAMDDLRKDFR